MPDPINRLNAALEGRYRIESKLGEGGMATVYLATDLRHERRVALKVLRSDLAACGLRPSLDCGGLLSNAGDCQAFGGP